MGKGEYDNQGYPMQPYYGGDSTQQPYYGGASTQQSQNPNMTNVITVGPQGGGSSPTSPVVIVQQEKEKPSMCCPICLACVTFWFFCPLWGCLGFFVAIGGMNASSVSSAKSHYRASVGLSVFGIVSVVVAAIIIVVLFFTVASVHTFFFNFYQELLNQYSG